MDFVRTEEEFHLFSDDEKCDDENKCQFCRKHTIAESNGLIWFECSVIGCQYEPIEVDWS